MRVTCSRKALRNEGEKKRVFLLENASLDAHLDADLCMTVVTVTD